MEIRVFMQYFNSMCEIIKDTLKYRTEIVNIARILLLVQCTGPFSAAQIIQSSCLSEEHDVFYFSVLNVVYRNMDGRSNASELL